ncbi:heterokaryon incompatibility protein-domain-containing protein [Hypoxylon rubiginosum]|uniref:Heterokaryon incompatibility protein-domain-containing protein n=1 Tax=Hypoxylon rubiginosum TaxID=110542 RepID=A0ACB9YMP0_9PEZI|nr:heterokaryon incompatibility protein-domain-containing protein [Hypoxylon rubiginosum]
MASPSSLSRLCHPCEKILRFPFLTPQTLSEADQQKSWKEWSPTLNPLGPLYVEQFLLYMQKVHTYPELSELLQSSKVCEFCQLLRSALQSVEFCEILNLGRSTPIKPGLPLHIRYSWDYDSQFESPDAKFGVWFLFVECHPSPESTKEFNVNNFNIGLRFPLTSDLKPYSPTLALRDPIQWDTLRGDAISFLQSEIGRCMKDCRHPRPARFLPTRLLEITENECRVIHTNGLQSSNTSRDVSYATLSYCWGDPIQASKQFKLTKDSEPSMLSSIHLDSLAPVHRDFVVLARALSIQYIWIDALCIRQGDRADWEREASQMERIYSCSYVTICPLTSTSCDEGFLSKNPQTVKLPFVFSSSTAGRHFNVEGRPIYGGGHSTISWTETEFRNCRWSRRAWTFQEQVMSSRLIYFANSGVHFMCRNKARSELFGTAKQFQKTLFLDELTDPRNKTELYKVWAVRVALPYSARNITFLTDTLPALSGLARYFASIMEDAYVAGLWKKDLLCGLFWRLQDPPHRTLDSLLQALQDCSDIGPSWSWICRGELSTHGAGELSMWDDPLQYNSKCESIDVTVTPRGVDEYGEISAAVLSLTGHVCPLSEAEWIAISRTTGICLLKLNTNGAVQYDLDWSSEQSEDRMRDLILILVGTATEKEPDDEDDSWSTMELPYGLILHPAPTGQGHVRVGTFGPPTSGGSFLSVGFFLDCEIRTLEIV